MSNLTVTKIGYFLRKSPWGETFQTLWNAAYNIFFFLKSIFCPFFMALLTDQLKIWQETGWERGGVTHSEGPQAGTRTQGCCSEDKSSVHGSAALLTELNSTPLKHILNYFGLLDHLGKCEHMSLNTFLSLCRKYIGLLQWCTSISAFRAGKWDLIPSGEMNVETHVYVCR